MEVDPIIPAVPPSGQFGSSFKRHFLSGEEEEFPGDEGMLTLQKLNGDGNKASLNNSEPQEARRTLSGSKTEGNLKRDSAAKDPSVGLRRLSNTSHSSRRQGSSNPAESEGEDTPIGLMLLSDQNDIAADSPNQAGSNDDMNYIDIKSFQKNNPKRIGSTGSRNQKSKKTAESSAYNLPENSIRNNRASNLEEKRLQLELEKEAFENSKLIHAQSMLDVDETIDTTQSSEQKFLSLEDVKGIFQDVKESRILNCVGDEALHGIDDGGPMGPAAGNNDVVYEEQALLGRITSGLRDSLQMLAPANVKTDEIPMEIAIPTPHEGSSGSDGSQPCIDTQVSALEKLEDDLEHTGGMGLSQPPAYLQEYQQAPAPAAAKTPVPSAAAAATPAAAVTPERAAPETTNTNAKDHPLQQMSPFERKVSKVILKQMQDEEARLEKERSELNALRKKGINAPENVLEAISFLRKKEKTRIQLEAAEANAKKKEESKMNGVVDDEYGDDGDEYVEENSQGAFGTLKKVLTHMYNPTGANEITLEDYEKQVREDEPPPPPPTTEEEQPEDDLDVVHEKSTGKKKKKNLFKFWKDSKSKSDKKNNNNVDGKKSSGGTKKKSGFFSTKRFKKPSSKKGGGEQIHAA
mmetsp:Transcript_29610/g.71264  ORF Transcript_29610/g.71264 Transcript_29610/m.71264 type:complete len:633 (+) Transcript_29610:92-1990(+)